MVAFDGFREARFCGHNDRMRDKSGPNYVLVFGRNLYTIRKPWCLGRLEHQLLRVKANLDEKIDHSELISRLLRDFPNMRVEPIEEHPVHHNGMAVCTNKTNQFLTGRIQLTPFINKPDSVVKHHLIEQESVLHASPIPLGFLESVEVFRELGEALIKETGQTSTHLAQAINGDVSRFRGPVLGRLEVVDRQFRWRQLPGRDRVQESV